MCEEKRKDKKNEEYVIEGNLINAKNNLPLFYVRLLQHQNTSNNAKKISPFLQFQFHSFKFIQNQFLCRHKKCLYIVLAAVNGLARKNVKVILLL